MMFKLICAISVIVSLMACIYKFGTIAYHCFNCLCTALSNKATAIQKQPLNISSHINVKRKIDKWEHFDIPSFIRKGVISKDVQDFIKKSDNDFVNELIAKAKRESIILKERVGLNKDNKKLFYVSNMNNVSEFSASNNSCIYNKKACNDDLFFNKNYSDLPVPNTVPSGSFL